MLHRVGRIQWGIAVALTALAYSQFRSPAQQFSQQHPLQRMPAMEAVGMVVEAGIPKAHG